MAKRDVSLALLVAFIWGVNFVVIDLALRDLPPLLLSALRFTLAAIPAILFVPFPKGTGTTVLAVGLLLGVGKFSVVFYAMTGEVSPGLASLLIQAQVFFTIGIAFIWQNELISKQQALGIIIGVLGLLLFIVADSGNVTVLGLMLMLCAAMCWAIANSLIKQLPRLNIFHFMVWMSFVPILPLFLLSYGVETKTPWLIIINLPLSTWLAVAFISYCSTLLAFGLWAYLLQGYSAAKVTPFALLVPLVGMLAANIVIGEVLTPVELIGCIFILIALILCVLKPQVLIKSIKKLTLASNG